VITNVSPAAVQASLRAHYYAVPTTTVLRPPAIVRFGAGFAFVQPMVFTVETQPPESGLDPHADQFHATVDNGTAAILVVAIVFVAIGDRVVKKVIRLS
jgi:hypothetical protein